MPHEGIEYDSAPYVSIIPRYSMEWSYDKVIVTGSLYRHSRKDSNKFSISLKKAQCHSELILSLSINQRGYVSIVDRLGTYQDIACKTDFLSKSSGAL